MFFLTSTSVPCVLLSLQVFLRFPASSACDYNALWGLLLPAVQPMVPRLMLEAGSARWVPREALGEALKWQWQCLVNTPRGSSKA